MELADLNRLKDCLLAKGKKYFTNVYMRTDDERISLCSEFDSLQHELRQFQMKVFKSGYNTCQFEYAYLFLNTHFSSLKQLQIEQANSLQRLTLQLLNDDSDYLSVETFARRVSGSLRRVNNPVSFFKDKDSVHCQNLLHALYLISQNLVLRSVNQNVNVDTRFNCSLDGTLTISPQN